MKQKITNFKENSSGAVIIVFAFVMTALFGVGGMALDYARAYRVKSAAQHALDGAALTYMITYLRTADEKLAKKTATLAFHGNLTEFEEIKLKIGPVAQVGQDLIVPASARTNVPTTVLAAIGYEDMDVSVEATSLVPIRSVTAAVVPDVSWSMRGKRLEAVKDAMEAFGDSMFGMVPAFEQRLEMGLVPYAGSVNISQVSSSAADLLTNWTYAAAQNSDSSRKGFYLPGGGCTNSTDRHIESISNRGNDTFIQVNKFKRELVETSSGTFMRCVNKGIVQTYQWSGCLQTTEDEFSSDNVLNDGSSPPMPPTIQAGAPHCPSNTSAMQANVRSRSDYRRYVQDMEIGFATVHDVGMLWARRLLTPGWASFFGTSARPWNNEDFPKFLLFLSDGKAKPIGYRIGEYPTRDEDSIDSHTRALCDSLKDNGVTIIGISFEHPKTPGNVETVESCASENEHYKANTSNVEELFAKMANYIKTREVRLVD